MREENAADAIVAGSVFFTEPPMSVFNPLLILRKA